MKFIKIKFRLKIINKLPPGRHSILILAIIVLKKNPNYLIDQLIFQNIEFVRYLHKTINGFESSRTNKYKLQGLSFPYKHALAQIFM